MVRNDNADEVAPNFWVFYGRWAAIPFIGGIFFVSIMNLGAFGGLDIVSSFILAVIPGALMTIFVICVNLNPPNYMSELADMCIFKFYEWLYMHGYTDRPPQIWYTGKPLRHPRA